MREGRAGNQATRRARASHRPVSCQSASAKTTASAIRGEFGDFHATARTEGSQLFINPLMAQYGLFKAEAVARRMP
jgi:hypothetical protein